LYGNTDEELKAKSPAFTKSARFFDSTTEGYFKHPYVLLSAAHHYKLDNFREKMGCSPDTQVFIDSGGYQLATGVISEKNYGNEVALKFSEANGDIFPILDRPGAERKIKDKNSPVLTFNDRLDLTKVSAQYYLDNRTRDNTTVMNVVQGSNMNSVIPWYNAMKQYPLDGWAHGGHLANMKTILSTIIHLWNDGEYDKDTIKVHHVFGISRAVVMLYLAVVQDELNKHGVDIQITYDSSYFTRTFAFGDYFMSEESGPLYQKSAGFTSLTLSNRFDYSNVPDDAKLPCICPICRDIVDIKEFLTNSVPFYTLGASHNLYQMLRYKDVVEDMLYMGIDAAIESAIPTPIWNNVMVIKEAFNNPIDGINIINRGWDNPKVARRWKQEQKSKVNNTAQSLDSFF
jgi:queuine/archaeosine tRNA-ribosyltransferase